MGFRPNLSWGVRLKFAQYSLAVVVVSSLLVGFSSASTAKAKGAPAVHGLTAQAAAFANLVQRNDGPAAARVKPRAGDKLVEGLAVAFPAGKIVLLVGDKEQEYPVASRVQVTERGAPTQWSVLHANSTLRLRIRNGKVVAVDIQ